MEDVTLTAESNLDSLNEVIWRENSNSAIPIHIGINKELMLDFIDRPQNIAKVIEERLLVVENLAKEAFFQKNKQSWDTIQKILYLWNIYDLYRKEEISDYRNVVQHVLRNRIIEIEICNKLETVLESKTDFTPEKATEELSDRSKSHRINNHPLLEELNKNGLPLNAVKTFINNYYINNRLFHMFIATLSLFVPLEKRTELSKNFYDEMGCGDNQVAHPILFLKNFNTIRKPDRIEPLPESLYLANSKFFAAFLCGNYHYGMGGFGCIELTMPEQMTKIFNGLKKSGLPRNDLEFWEVHIVIDVEHGKTWLKEMSQLLSTPEEAEFCLKGGLALLEARATMYDGVWNHITKYS